jgi:hypothetical protein
MQGHWYRHKQGSRMCTCGRDHYPFSFLSNEGSLSFCVHLLDLILNICLAQKWEAYLRSSELCLWEHIYKAINRILKLQSPVDNSPCSDVLQVIVSFPAILSPVKLQKKAWKNPTPLAQLKMEPFIKEDPILKRLWFEAHGTSWKYGLRSSKRQVEIGLSFWCLELVYLTVSLSTFAFTTLSCFS